MTCNFAAKARNQIVIQEPQLTATATGGSSLSWSNLLTAFAIIEPSTARERFETQQKIGVTTHKITIRYNSDLANVAESSKYRVVFGSRIFSVNSIENLHTDLKTEGTAFQKLRVVENEPELEE